MTYDRRVAVAPPVRVEVLDTVVRLFPTRQRAIQECNLLTRSTDQQYREVRTNEGGYIVHNVVTKTYKDMDGMLSPAVVSELLKASYR